jgi:hypothetical protein
MPDTEVEKKLGTLASWVTAGLCFIVVFAISSMGVMTYSAFKSGQNASDLKALTERVSRESLSICRELERGKAQQRADAKNDYKNFERNAGLLGVTVTEELRQAVRESYEHKLEVYAPNKCPRE